MVRLTAWATPRAWAPTPVGHSERGPLGTRLNELAERFLSFFLGRDAVVHADFVAQAHHADCVFERDVAVASNQD